ncbi:hypothetical protein FQN50_009708 [Emmonsiellopsis sp. PD_5]|nr:hypothetical protein FQN50_009708 [Emmonsiellopsis sp. PD_5]
MLNAILSLPMLSFLLIPTMSSYSTSLNLLFFYITWATLVLSIPRLKVEMVSTIAVRVLLYLLPSMTFFLFDVLFPSAAAAIKAQGAAGLPAGKKGKRGGRREVKVAAWSVFNLAMGLAAQMGVEVVLTRVVGVKSAVKVSTRLPLPWDIVVDLGMGFVLREILQYTIHRYILHSHSHSPSPTSYLAKCHDTWYHSLKAPYPLTAHYDHPLPYLISRFLPTFFPAALLRFHLLTYLLYLSLVSMEELFAYSGYSTMPTNFFIGGIARRADLHVLSKGCGNYGAWGVLDWICGTTVGSEGEEEDGNIMRGEEGTEEVDVGDVLDVVGEEPRKKVKALKQRARRGKGS